MVLGYTCALLVGISLGALGMGGSILTIPILVYLMGVSPMDATGYSLFIVGVTSSVGAARYIRNQLVDLRMASAFAIPSVITVFLTRTFLVPAIPHTLFLAGQTVSRDLLVLVLFAVLMMVAGYRMLLERHYDDLPVGERTWHHTVSLVALGALAGLLTGILGVGGGFIIVPALVLFARIPIRMSVGTSLLIIALNSWVGFCGELIVRKANINYGFLLLFSLFSVLGILLGFSLASRIASLQLKKVFGWIVLVTGICIFMKEIFFS